MPELLKLLGGRRWTNVLVEGGARVLGSFLDAQAIDQVHVFIAPRLAGGRGAPAPIAGRGCSRIADALGLEDYQVEMIEGDIYVHGSVGKK